MTTPTANYGWIKPDVGASADAWGGLLNTDLDGIDSTVKSVSNVANAALPSATASTTYVAKAGDTMTGNLTVSTSGSGVINVTSSTGNASLQLNKVTATGGISCALWGETNGSLRWIGYLGNGTAEGSGNAGSDFQLSSYDNTGAALGTPLAIKRATGLVQWCGNGATAYAPTPPAGSSWQTMSKSASGTSVAILGATNGVPRWAINLGDNTAEGGSNAGSNFSIGAYSDNGTFGASPISIVRATQVCTFSQAIVNGPSDRRLKENIAPLEGSLDKVLALQGVSYNLIANPNMREIGLIAQDVQPIVPEIVQVYNAATDPEATPQAPPEPMLALDYPKLVALLIEAVKTLAARVEVLENGGSAVPSEAAETPPTRRRRG
jgi:trimeric autotransporter adhesin